MTEYNFNNIEKKWQKKWEEKKAFEVKESKGKKFYVLDMFPYPSGSGLHMGHAFVFSLGDIFARFKRLQGYNVLYPIGYDSLGLPAENAAIKAGTHPKKYTEKSIANFMKQQKAMGWSYDWSRMVKTSDPSFYKWDQWIFLKMLEKGIAYRKKASVNWCPKCETVLANEQVVKGCCWRHEDTNVQIKHLEQWFFRITNYADELLKGLDKLDWSENAKKLQRNWIGKSFGAEVQFEIINKNSNCFIVHGSPIKDRTKDKDYIPDNEKHWLKWIKTRINERGIKCNSIQMPTPWNPKYNEWKKVLDKENINENSILIGHSAGGAFLVRYLDEEKKKIKKLILISPGKAGKESRNTLSDLYGDKVHEKIKKNIDEIVIFTSDDDHGYHIESAYEYEKELEAKVIKLGKGFGHFTSSDMKTEEFPELLNQIIEKWPIFTTRSDTIFGVTFMVVSAQHPRLMELVTDKQKKSVEEFLKKIKSVSMKSMKDQDDLDKEGVFTGSYAINPMTNEKVPVYAGNFVLADYGSGMVMAVPAHDQRDFEFAKKYNISIRVVIQPKENKIITITESLNKEFYTKVSKFAKIVNSGGLSYIYTDKVDEVFTLAKNNFIGSPGYIHSEGKIKKILFNSDKENKIFDWNNEKGIKEAKDYGLKIKIKKEQLDFNELREAYTDYGVLINSAGFNDLESDEAKEHVIKAFEAKKLGKKTVQYKLRDWLISRQRYWGTPIPIIYCNKCGIVPVPEKDLPIKLPEKVRFGEGNPLATNKEFVNVKCPKCKENARRETDTMDTFVNSSWYYLRYTDPKNSKKIFDEKKTAYWTPIDQYIGGPEHITMHLIYIRFYAKFLRDLGLLKFDEPALRYFTQGIVHGSDGEKMSKSRGNVVEPLDMIEKYGADTLRLALVSFASPDNDTNWDEKIVFGSHKFLNRVYEYFSNIKYGKADAGVESKINKLIKETTIDIENFKHNLAVIKLRTFFDYIQDKQIDKKTAEKYFILLSVYCPHISEELWEKICGKGFISLAKWSEVDEKKIDLNLEKQEEAFEKTVGDIVNILKIIKERQGKEGDKIYLYVIPNELASYDADVLTKRLNKTVKVYAVNDKNKYDPENKAGKAKSGRPAVFVE